MWVLAISIAGMVFLAAEPFESEASCVLTAKTIKAVDFNCIEMPDSKELEKLYDDRLTPE